MSSPAQKALPGASEDRDLKLVAVAEFGPGLGQLRAHLVVERIEALGSVHSHDEDLPVTFGLDDSHGSSLRFGGTI